MNSGKTSKTIQNHQLVMGQEIVNSNSEADAEKKQRSFFSPIGGRWILLASMAVLLIITAILIAMLTISLLDNEDQCLENPYSLQRTSYNLFSTKTTYSTAFHHLDGSSSSPAFSSSSAATNNRYSSASLFQLNRLPNIFSRTESLGSLNERLLANGNCKVRQFHYFGRHAARFPSSRAIEEINKHMGNIQARIDLSKFSTPSNSQANRQGSAGNNNSTVQCFNPLTQYKHWLSPMTPDQGNLLMDSGFEETLAIAKRFKSIYSELFDGRRTKIELGTTEELRTAQTALAFLKQIDNFTTGVCDLDQFPTDNLSDKRRAEDVGSSTCYKQLLQKYNLDKLQFHKLCEKYHKEDFPIQHGLNLKEPNRTRSIASSVSKKLKLVKAEDQLNSDEIDSIYDVCKYETSLAGSSIWCNLFTEQELKLYEFINDVDDYFKVYAHPDQWRSACPVTTELMRAFRGVLKSQAATAEARSQQLPEAHFYFTHSKVIQTILASSVDLEQDPDYSPRSILAHLAANSSPDSRQWRTSIFAPFSANLAFTLYECTGDKSPSGDGDSPNDSSQSESPFKVVASLNERPILLDGCSNYVCDLAELTTDSRIDREKRCRMEDICRKNIVVT